MKAKEKALKHLESLPIFKYGKPTFIPEAIDIAIKETRTEIFDLYLKELKRIKPLFKGMAEKGIIQQLIYFTYNNKKD